MVVLAVDAGQSGVRLRGGDAPGDVTVRPGVRADSDVLDQIAETVADFLNKRRVRGGWTLAIGLSGLPDVTGSADRLSARLTALGVRRTLVAHDSVTSFLGALGQGAGATIAAGTGVVTLATGPGGVARVDGLGHLIDDAGSGYWLGREGITAALRARDGRGPATALLQEVTAVFGEVDTLPPRLLASGTRVADIAALAPAVLRAAESGDEAAQRIAERGADELALSAATAVARTGWAAGEEVTVSWAGNLLGRSDRYRDLVGRALRRRRLASRLVRPLGDCLDGAGALPTLSPHHPLASSVSRAATDDRRPRP